MGGDGNAGSEILPKGWIRKSSWWFRPPSTQSKTTIMSGVPLYKVKSNSLTIAVFTLYVRCRDSLQPDKSAQSVILEIYTSWLLGLWNQWNSWSVLWFIPEERYYIIKIGQVFRRVIKGDLKCQWIALKTPFFSITNGSPDIKDKLVRESKVSESFIQSHSKLIRVILVPSGFYHCRS